MPLESTDKLNPSASLTRLAVMGFALIMSSTITIVYCRAYGIEVTNLDDLGSLCAACYHKISSWQSVWHRGYKPRRSGGMINYAFLLNLVL